MKKSTIIVILFLLILTSCDYGFTTEREVRKACEQAYFEGQKDALKGDVRIKRNNDSCWIWTESPWNTEREPIFNPSYNCK